MRLCGRGLHEMTEENTRHNPPCASQPNGARVCRACITDRRADPKYRRKEAAARVALRRALKLRVFAAYGGVRCACCGEEHADFLTLDHVDNDGGQERKEIGKGTGVAPKGRGGTDVYKRLVRRGFPPGYQVLCFNCNCAKGRCPDSHAGRDRVVLTTAERRLWAPPSS